MSMSTQQRFWTEKGDKRRTAIKHEKVIQPFSVYHVHQPHAIRKKHGHLGASPKCRASISDSMDLLVNLLQPSFNQDINNIFKKYIDTLQQAAENGFENYKRDAQSMNFEGISDKEGLYLKACKDMLENAKLLFKFKNNLQETTENKSDNIPSALPQRLHNIPKRAPSPDLYSKAIKNDKINTVQRSFTPPPSRKRQRMTRKYGTNSPYRNGKENIKREGPTWDPNNLTESTQFIMGTKANKALGLGATRGRIYMKHPDLFKYAGDPDDKKWMVKNNCMPATGGKNAFILIAEDVKNLLKTEYKENPGIIYDELDFFKLPEFILQKMRTNLIREKKLGEELQQSKSNTASPVSWKSASPNPADFTETSEFSNKGIHGRRHAARAAEYAIAFTSQQQNSEDDLESNKRPSNLRQNVGINSFRNAKQAMDAREPIVSD